MHKGNDKRGLMPSQPAAALSALDFAATSEALRRAKAAGEDAARTGDELATEAAADLVAELSDRLISTPISDPARIAEKVTAYAWLHNAASGLDNPAQQRWIAENGNDAAKGLLAVYLDLVSRADAVATERAEWQAALSAYEVARGKRDALIDASDDEDGAYNASSDEAWSLLEALLATPAPDGEAMGVKARLVIEQAHTDWLGDSPDNPQTIARLLAGDWSEAALASLYIDGLRLSGSDSPIIHTKPDSFDPEAWLSEVEAATGARLSKSDQWNNVAFTPAREGADVAEATARLASLYQDHQGAVGTFAANRDRDVDFREPPEPMTPEREAAAREALIDALANLSAKGGERDWIRDHIAKAARPWVLEVEERGTGLAVQGGDK